MPEPLEPSAAPARLLVVDDIELNRDLLVRRARRLGHDSGVAEDGEAALVQLRAAPWDLVLLDITMPRMDGYEVLRQIRADPQLAHIPVIMVSAIDEIDSVVRCLELGADDYVTKPFNPVLLQARIEASLAKKRLADQKQATLRAMARELDIGQRIQRGFLPAALPMVPGWQLAACCEPARQVGGDFYDAIALQDGRLVLVLADVCDKGVGAALYMALFRTLLRALFTRSPHDGHSQPGDGARLIAQAVSFVNDYIAHEHGRDNMFATMFVAVLQPSSGELAWANMGHDAPLVVAADGRVANRLEPGAAAVGLMPGLQPRVQQLRLAPGDRLVAYTDGVTEAAGEDGPWGEERLLALLQDAPGADAQALLDGIARALAAHVGTRPAHDDVTLLIVGRAA